MSTFLALNFTSELLGNYARESAIHFASLLVMAIVWLVPGWLVAGATGVHRAINPLLRPAVALVFTLVLVSPALALSLWQGLPILIPMVWMAAVACIGAVGWRVFRREEAREWQRRSSTGARWKDWKTGHAVAWWVAAFAGILGYVSGTTLSGDTFYHAGVAQRLLKFSDPHFSDMSRFVDGGSNPAYLLPSWHELVSLSSALTPLDPISVIWVLPVIINVVMVLTWAGLAEILIRRSAAAGVAAVAVVCTRFLGQNLSSLKESAYPGFIVLDIVLPLIVACIVAGIWYKRGADRIRIMATACVCIVSVAILHANYMLFVLLILGGYAAFWWFQSPWPRTVVRPHIVSAVVLAGTATLAMGAVIPSVRKLSYFGKGTDPETSVKSLERFAGAFIKTGEDAFYLDPKLLVVAGGTFALGLLCIAIAARWRTEPLAWTLVGPVVALLFLMRSTNVFPSLIEMGNTAMFIRGWRIIPEPIALAAAALFLAWGFQRLQEYKKGSGHIASLAASGIGLLIGVIFAAAGNVSWRWIPGLTLIILFIISCVWLGQMLVRILRGMPAEFVSEFVENVERPVIKAATPWFTLMATLTIVLVAVPQLGRSTEFLWLKSRHRPLTPTSEGYLGKFPPKMIEKLSADPGSTVVMARPERGWEIPAVSPAFVVADHKDRLADTPVNKPGQRKAVAERFFASDTRDVERKRILKETKATHILLMKNQKDDNSVLEFIRRNQVGFTLVAQGNRTILYALRKDLRE